MNLSYLLLFRCRPCTKFTPILAQFYNEMKRKGKRFEIVWVSRDDSIEAFTSYYQKMPWLAVTEENIEQCLELTAQKYQVNGIPHLVIVDGIDATIYTLDGRHKVSQDTYGLEFPWRSRTLLNLLPRSAKANIHALLKKMTNNWRKKFNQIVGLLLPRNGLLRLKNNIGQIAKLFSAKNLLNLLLQVPSYLLTNLLHYIRLVLKINK